MPNVNAYFYFLELTAPECIKHAKNDTPYALLPLTQHCGQLIVIDGTEYMIADHHISVYQDYTSFSHKSVYHHTMHLKNEHGELYTIRTYFDGQDAKKGAVSFKKRISDDEQETIELSVDDANKLAALASAYSLNKMQAIHMAYQTDIVARKEVFEQKITFLFQASVADALEKMPMYIEEAALLECLNVGRYQTFLKQYQASFQAKQKLEAQKAFSEAKVETIAEVQNDDMLMPSASVKAEEQIQPNQIAFEACMNALRQHQEYMASFETTPPERAVAINAAFLYVEKAQNANLQLLNDDFYIQSEDLQRIHEALIESEEACLSYLKDALFHQEKDIYEDARFVPYAQKIPEKMLAMFIGIKSIDVTCWLLQHGQFSLNHIQIALRNENPATLLEIAFKAGNVVCFKALLEAGASSLLITKNGIPFAHQVYASRIKIFVDTLDDYLITSNQKQNVYKSLAKMTRMCLASPEVSFEEKEKMERELPNYERGQYHMTKSAAYGAKERTALNREVLQLTGLTEDDICRLEATPAYQLVLEQLVDAIYHYKKCLPAKHQRGTERKEQAVFRGFVERMQNNPIYQSKPTDESIIATLEEQIATLREASDLIVLTQACDQKRSRYPSKKLPRKIKQEADDLAARRLALQKRAEKQMPLSTEETSRNMLKKIGLVTGRTFSSAEKAEFQSNASALLANSHFRERIQALRTSRNQKFFERAEKRIIDYIKDHPDEDSDLTWEKVFVGQTLTTRERDIVSEHDKIMADFELCSSPSC